jgi:hypothetical protein
VLLVGNRQPKYAQYRNKDSTCLRTRARHVSRQHRRLWQTQLGGRSATDAASDRCRSMASEVSRLRGLGRGQRRWRRLTMRGRLGGRGRRLLLGHCADVRRA